MCSPPRARGLAYITSFGAFFGSAGDVVLNFPPYLIKMHIGLNGPKFYFGPINPVALLCGVLLLLISLDSELQI